MVTPIESWNVCSAGGLKALPELNQLNENICQTPIIASRIGTTMSALAHEAKYDFGPKNINAGLLGSCRPESGRSGRRVNFE